MGEKTPFDPASAFLEPGAPPTPAADKAKPKTGTPARPKIVNLADARSEGWMDQLQRSDRGFKGNDYNVTVALETAPELSGKFGWDVRQLAYVALTETPAGPAGRWTDSHSAKLAVWLQKLGLPITMRHVETALAAVTRRQEVDPLGEYLSDLSWDGHERIGTWLADYCQADASPANSIMGSKFLIGAVARALRPGCKMDTMLVLEGDQGKRKSMAIKILGGDYTGENLPDFHSKDAMQIVGCKWIIEVSELAAARRSEREAIKSFITRREDTFRPPYGRHPITVPRWSVLIGNYNPDGVGILEDSTGGRRFWIVGVGEIDAAKLTEDRDQLWAEAVHCYRRGDEWWLSEDEQSPVAVQQLSRTDDDEWLAAIERWLATDPQTGEPRLEEVGHVTSAQVATGALAIPLERLSRSTQMRVVRCLITLGFKRTKIGPNNARRNAFLKS